MTVTITAAAATIKGTVAQGAVLAIGGVTTPGTPSTAFQAVGGIVDISASGVKLGSLTSTDLSSPNVRRIGTTLDFGTITATVKNANSDTGQATITTAQLARVPYDFAIQYPDHDSAKTVTVTFSALVTEFGAVDLADDKDNTAKVELSLDGPWSVAAA